MRKFILYVKITARRLSNPVFFMLLALSVGLWYISKLSHVYTATVNIPVRIDSMQISVRCNVEGVRYRILRHKIAPGRNRVIVSAGEVALTPSDTASNRYDISPFALQNAISSQISDLKIKSVRTPDEIGLSRKQP